MHTALAGLARHVMRPSKPFMLEPVSSTDTETDTAGVPRGACGKEARWPSVRRLPTTCEEVCWSGQQPKARQHGNMNAISAGTKQQTLFLSSMHGLAVA